jgi:hypothetical protein
MKRYTKIVAINVFLIYLLIPLTVLSLDVSACNVDMCSREYSSVLSLSQQQWTADTPESGQQYCSLLNAYQHCLRSISRSCRGNLEFHTLQTLLKNYKTQHNCSQTSTQAINNIKTIVAPIHRKTIPSMVSTINSHWRPSEDKNVELQEKLQTCLSAAYNYTINGNHSSNTPIDERTRLLNEQNMRTTSHPRKNRNRGRRERDVNSKFVPISGETVDLDEDIDKNEFDSNPISSTVPSVKPLMPPSPPLTCIIYGDPHLRTFDNTYQTCRCSGAWPLIDHPLFAVQITNSRIKGSSPQVTGVTKVTVLVRQFSKCGIHNDLLYEAESTQGSTTPSSTFIDGSTSNSNNLIRITQSSNNNVITIHLDHIGVRVYIGQFESQYLNVVIKFRSATSTVKQQLVLNSISSNSLCKMGCPKREQIDIENILKATGVDINANTENSAQNSDNYVNELKSDSSVMDTNDEPTDDQLDSSEPCHDLWGYFRISCLYDQTIKGVKHVNNANRFAQSFDEKKFIQNSIDSNVNSVTNNDYSLRVTNSSPTLSSNHCLNIILFFVISLINCL